MTVLCSSVKQFAEAFLLTYYTFITPEELISKLLSRYVGPLTPHSPASNAALFANKKFLLFANHTIFFQKKFDMSTCWPADACKPNFSVSEIQESICHKKFLVLTLVLYNEVLSEVKVR